MLSTSDLFRRLQQFDDLSALALPAREGPRPNTTPSTPHHQLDQNAPIELQHRLRDYAIDLPAVRSGPSEFSVPGTVAFFLDQPPLPSSIPEMSFCEWGHIHPSYDGSMHISLPTATAERLIQLGWAEYHRVVTRGLVPPMLVMVYGPRNETELAVTSRLLDASYLASGGDLRTPPAKDLNALVDTGHPTIALPTRLPCPCTPDD